MGKITVSTWHYQVHTCMKMILIISINNVNDWKFGAPHRIFLIGYIKKFDLIENRLKINGLKLLL